MERKRGRREGDGGVMGGSRRGWKGSRIGWKGISWGGGELVSIHTHSIQGNYQGENQAAEEDLKGKWEVKKSWSTICMQ